MIGTCIPLWDIFRINKEKQIYKQKKKQPHQKVGEGYEQTLSKEDICVVNKHIKRKLIHH